MTRHLQLTTFRELSLADPFFDSLKAGYREFPDWFRRKADEELYVVKEDGGALSGMIYLKEEHGLIDDIEPALPEGKWLKVGTLKIEGRGTKLGERILKKILDTAIYGNMDGIYVTVFELHEDLIRLFQRYGFVEHGTKATDNGVEVVLVRKLADLVEDIILDYPFFHTQNVNAWLLAIYPEYHTQILPDSILNNEPREIVRDVSHTNTIHKVYIGGVPLTRMARGDIVIFYRTTDHQGPAYYRSVATSVCIVEETRRKQDFQTRESFIEYARPYSVFSDEELAEWYDNRQRLYVAKMTYNAAFNRRVTRQRLLDEARIPESPQWDMKLLTRGQLQKILEMGEINESLTID